MIEDSLASVAVPGKLNKQDTGNFGQPKEQDEVDREYELCASQIKASFNQTGDRKKFLGGTGIKVDKLEDSMVSGSLNDRDDDDNAASGYNHLVIPNQQEKLMHKPSELTANL